MVKGDLSPPKAEAASSNLARSASRVQNREPLDRLKL